MRTGQKRRPAKLTAERELKPEGQSRMRRTADRQARNTVERTGLEEPGTEQERGRTTKQDKGDHLQHAHGARGVDKEVPRPN